MDFVAIYKQWTEQTGDGTLSNFLLWLGTNCHVTPGEVMTDTEFQAICELAGVGPEDAAEVLMEMAWP